MENEINKVINELEQKLNRKLTDSEKIVANHSFTKGFEDGIDTYHREVSIDMFM